MLLLRAIIRPEKVKEVLDALLQAGYSSVTKMEVYGRGKQKGIQIGAVFYDEIPKEMLLLFIEDEAKNEAVDIIMKAARTGENGNSGDGRIFISPVDSAYTISTDSEGL
ncbi:MAG: P-II family nitrogen regulator [Anaerostipes sp.]|nr:P-II family nitrogen regulator [Anaerostipes sp.]